MSSLRNHGYYSNVQKRSSTEHITKEGAGKREDCGDAVNKDYYIRDNSRVHSYSGHKGRSSRSLREESVSISVSPVLYYSNDHAFSLNKKITLKEVIFPNEKALPPHLTSVLKLNMLFFVLCLAVFLVIPDQRQYPYQDYIYVIDFTWI